MVCLLFLSTGVVLVLDIFFFSSRRRHTRCSRDWSSDVCSSDLRFGIISFHHGDNRINRGGPAGFWECYYEWPQTGFIIQRLTEELDAGDVLVRGSYATRYYYSLNQAHLYKKSNTHLKNLLARITSKREF